MQTKLKIIVFIIVVVILVGVAVLGYNAYVGQKTKPGAPYKTSLVPTAQPTTTASGDKTADIKRELDTTSLSDLESELKSLEDEAVGL